MTMIIIHIKGILSKFMVAWQNTPLGASKPSALRPFFPKKNFFLKKKTFFLKPQARLGTFASIIILLLCS